MINPDEQEDITIYEVVMNHEEQYSIWPLERDIPLGWKTVGKSGLKQACLDYIAQVWTDMRPLSLRRHMEMAAQQPEPPRPISEASLAASNSRTGDDLVDRLSERDQPVEVSLRTEKSAQALRDCIDRGYVQIKFTATQGGTELGVRLDPDRLDLSQADFAHNTGMVHLEGKLNLNYIEVQCIVDIDLKTLTGKGRLETV